MSETGMIDKPLAPWGTSVWRREGRMSSCFHTVEREEHSYHFWRVPQLFGLSVYSSIPNRPQLTKALIAGSLKLSPCKPAWL